MLHSITSFIYTFTLIVKIVTAQFLPQISNHEKHIHEFVISPGYWTLLTKTVGLYYITEL